MLKNKLLIIVISALVLLSLNFFQKEVKNFFYLISSPFQQTLWQAGNSLAGFLESMTKSQDLQKENLELKLKVQGLLAENTSLKALEEENRALREALNISPEKEFQLEIARVTSKDITGDSILIDKGSKDGSLEGLPVITQQKVLLGKVVEVYEDFSRIMLTYSSESVFSAKVQDREVEGVVKGRGGFSLELDLIPKDKEVEIGDFVVTSQLGGDFPSGLLIGEIEKVRRSDADPFQAAEIKPVFDLKNLDILFIIKAF